MRHVVCDNLHVLPGIVKLRNCCFQLPCNSCASVLKNFKIFLKDFSDMRVLTIENFFKFLTGLSFELCDFVQTLWTISCNF